MAWNDIVKDNSSISSKSFLAFFNAINNIYQPWMSDDRNDYRVKNENEAYKLHWRFFSFYERRQLNHQPNRNMETKQHSYQPSINQTSKNLAKMKLEQLKSELNKLNIEFSHDDYLIKKGAIMEKRKQRK